MCIRVPGNCRSRTAGRGHFYPLAERGKIATVKWLICNDRSDLWAPAVPRRNRPTAVLRRRR